MGTLEDELASASDTGIDFRLGVLLESAQTTVDNPIELPAEDDSSPNATIAISDPNIGQLLLTSANNVPFSAILDTPIHTHPYAPDAIDPSAFIAAPEPRAPYHPDESFFQPSQLPQLAKAAADRKVLGTDLKAKVLFNPATLKLMEDAHRILGDETLKLGLAAADLFRRCERMQAELREQVRRVNEIAAKVDGVAGGDAEDGEEASQAGKQKIDERIQRSWERTEGLNERVETLRKKMLRLGGQQLSAKEMAFAEEVERLRLTIDARSEGIGKAEKPAAPTNPSALVHMPNSEEEQDQTVAQQQQHLSSPAAVDEDEDADGSLAARLEAVRQLHSQLVQQVSEAEAREAEASSSTGKRATMAGGVSADYRRQKLAQVFALLERETALVDAVTERLGRLTGA